MMKVARLQDRIRSVAELHRFTLCTRRSVGTANEGGGSTDQLCRSMGVGGGGGVDQLDLQSRTPLSVADCGQLGVLHLGYFSRLLQVVDN